jgi:hypothetical protein
MVINSGLLMIKVGFQVCLAQEPSIKLNCLYVVLRCAGARIHHLAL